MRMIHYVGAQGARWNVFDGAERRRDPPPAAGYISRGRGGGARGRVSSRSRSQRRRPVGVAQHGVERQRRAAAVGGGVRRERGGAQQQQQQRLEGQRGARHAAHEAQAAPHAEQRALLLTLLFIFHYRSVEVSLC